MGELMPITLTSLMVSGPLLVPLASGGTVRLSPGQTSGELPDVDAGNNPMLDKLLQRGMVELRRTTKPATRSGKQASPPAPPSDT
jgi:hypothetical protein